MASIVFNRHNKRKNRINPEKLFEFKDLAVPGSSKSLSGSFRDNIRVFLRNFAEIEEYTFNGRLVWCTSCVAEDKGVFPLYTIEETVQYSTGSPFCAHCESSEWGHHFVCKRKYHFIIPAKEHWDEQLDGDFEENQCHDLYGLIHCNGYGHLICSSGLKNNSKFFSADDSMKFWDRLCTVLKARCISASNISTRETIELSLCHGIVHGKSWFEKWDYKFRERKCPKITEEKLNAAVLSLRSLSLGKLVSDFKMKKSIERFREMIETYRKFSDKPLITLGNLLKSMLAFESRMPMDLTIVRHSNSETGEIPMRFDAFVEAMMRDCRWSSKRLEDVLIVIVELLKQHKEGCIERERGMSRQELRDEARKSIGDTGLIDFVLKSIKCFAVDNQIICRAVNPFSRLTEFTIYEISPGTSTQLAVNLSEDLKFLYNNVLECYPETKVVLQSIFVKEWPVKSEIVNNSMELVCKVFPGFDELYIELGRPLSPGEVVVVEPQNTIGDLKMAAQCALRDTYCIMDEFVVTQIGGMRKIDDTKVLNTTVEPGSQVWVRGHGLNFDTHLRHEDGGRKTRHMDTGRQQWLRLAFTL